MLFGMRSSVETFCFIYINIKYYFYMSRTSSKERYKLYSQWILIKRGLAHELYLNTQTIKD